MQDVAERAGVSQPTVSLVLGDNPEARVADATRERVLAAARELGYRPNLLAAPTRSASWSPTSRTPSSPTW